MWRRRSPSVTTPTSRPSPSQAPTQPKLLAVITRIASDIGASGETSGTASPTCMMSATRNNRRPSRPPGWNKRKSAVEKPRRSRSAIAKASPSAIIAVVEVVGASPIGQASGEGGNSRTASAAAARVERQTRRDRDQRDVEPARIRDDVGKLGRLAGIRQCEDHVLGGDHAEIAVARFAGVDELRRRPCRGQGGGNLARDVTALADAGDDDPPASGGAKIDRRRESLAKRRRELFKPADFGPQHPPGDLQDRFRRSGSPVMAASRAGGDDGNRAVHRRGAASNRSNKYAA